MKLFITLVFSALIFMSLMQPVDGIYHKVSLIISFFIIIISILQHKKISIHNVQASVFFSMYTFFCVIAAGVNQDMNLLKNSLQLFCMFLAVSIFFNDLVKEHVIQIVVNSVLLAYVPFICLCFLQARYMFGGFAGVFENPNTMGFSMIGLMVAVLIRLYQLTMKILHERQQPKLILLFVFYATIYLICLYIILLSNARTSLLTAALVTIVVIVSSIKNLNKTFVPFLKFSALFAATVLVVFIAFMKMDRMQDAIQSIVLKMEKNLRT